MSDNRPLIDPVMARPRRRPVVSQPQLSAAAPTTPASSPLRLRNIDGVVRHGPVPAAPAAAAEPAVPLTPSTPKPHLQPHPLLRRPAQLSMEPVRPRPVKSSGPPAETTGGPAPSRTGSQVAVATASPAVVKAVITGTGRPQPQLRKHWNAGKLTVFTIIIGSIFGLLSLFSLQLGEIVIAVYALAALLRRLPSRLTFLLALVMFGGIIIAQLAAPDNAVSENLAVYAFLLLCVGTLSLALEVRRDGHETA